MGEPGFHQSREANGLEVSAPLRSSQKNQLTSLGGGFKYFSDWLKPPTSNLLFCLLGWIFVAVF